MHLHMPAFQFLAPRLHASNASEGAVPIACATFELKSNDVLAELQAALTGLQLPEIEMVPTFILKRADGPIEYWQSDVPSSEFDRKGLDALCTKLSQFFEDPSLAPSPQGLPSPEDPEKASFAFVYEPRMSLIQRFMRLHHDPHELDGRWISDAIVTLLANNPALAKKTVLIDNLQTYWAFLAPPCGIILDAETADGGPAFRMGLDFFKYLSAVARAEH